MAPAGTTTTYSTRVFTRWNTADAAAAVAAWKELFICLLCIIIIKDTAVTISMTVLCSFVILVPRTTLVWTRISSTSDNDNIWKALIPMTLNILREESMATTISSSSRSDSTTGRMHTLMVTTVAAIQLDNTIFNTDHIAHGGKMHSITTNDIIEMKSKLLVN